MLKLKMNTLLAGLMFAEACSVSVAHAAQESGPALFEKLARCSGGLASGELYESYVPGLMQLRRNSEAALEYLATSRGYQLSLADEFAKASHDTYQTELSTNPRNARGALSQLARECRAHLVEAESLHNSDQAAVQKRLAEAEETKLRERLRSEAETERLKAEAQQAQAEADKLRADAVEREEAAKQATIRAEADAKARVEAAKAEAVAHAEEVSARKFAEAQARSLQAKPKNEVVETAIARSPDSSSDDDKNKADTSNAKSLEAIEGIRQAAGVAGVKVCEQSEAIVRRWIEAYGIDMNRFHQFAKADLGAVKTLNQGAFLYFSDLAARIANRDTSENGAESQLRSGDMALRCMIAAAALSGQAHENVANAPAASTEREITYIGDDPTYGAYCYSWAHVVRSWHDQQFPVSAMRMQAEQVLGEPVQLYAILMDTIDALANQAPNIEGMIRTNRWNDYCVKRLSGRI